MRSIMPILSALVLCACASQPYVSSQVSTFHELPPDWKGSTVAVVPHDADAEHSLEWRSYRSRVEDQLKKAGFVIATPEEAQLLAYFAYAIDGGKQVQRTYSVPQFGVTGYSGGYTTGTVYSYGGLSTYSGTTTLTPQYGVTGYSTGVDTYTRFTRSLSVDIVNAANREKLWEMRLKSSGVNRRAIGTPYRHAKGTPLARG
jgi:hypothetical protein